jgi:hypothetical protein
VRPSMTIKKLSALVEAGVPISFHVWQNVTKMKVPIFSFKVIIKVGCTVQQKLLKK